MKLFSLISRFKKSLKNLYSTKIANGWLIYLKRLLKNPLYGIQKNKVPLLFTPGPVILSSKVKKSLSQDMWHHRSKEFKNILKQISSDLKEIFQTKQPVLILNSSGTGAMEAAVSNILSPGEEALCVSAGKFGERWGDIAQAFQIKTHFLTAPLGSFVSPQAIQKELEKNKKIRAVFLSACETSTATEQPIKEITQILKTQVLLIVDGITGLGAMELKTEEWGIDVLIAGSQKSFMLPTGLAFITLSKRAWDRVESSRSARYYFDLKKEKSAQEQGQTAFSSSVTLLRALKESLNDIKKQGLSSHIAKSQVLKESTHLFCKEMGLSLFSSRPANAVTAIKFPENLSAGEIKQNLQKYHGIVVAGGQGSLKNKILRWGHLGPIKFSDHLKGLKALALELKKKDPIAFNDQKIKAGLKKARKALKAAQPA